MDSEPSVKAQTEGRERKMEKKDGYKHCQHLTFIIVLKEPKGNKPVVSVQAAVVYKGES